MSIDQFPTEQCQRLLGEVDATCQRARIVAVGTAVANALAATMAVVLVAATGDLLLKSNHASVRYIVSIAALIAVVCIFSRLWLRLRGFNISRRDLAGRLSRQDCASGTSLASIVELAEMADCDDPRFGSRELRASVLQQWFSSSAEPAWSQVVDSSALRSSIFLLVAIVGAVVCAAVASPGKFGWALWRVTAPVSSAPWPRETQLVFVNLPEAVAMDESLLVRVEDLSPPLPRSVSVEYMTSSDSEPSVFVAGPPQDGTDSVVAVRLPAAAKDFKVRAVGGDHRDMPWRDVAVVRTPTILRTTASIEPPEYSGLESQEIDGQRFRVLAGSTVELRGSFTQPLDNALLRNSQKAPDPSSDPNTKADQWRISIGRDKKSFTISQLATGELATGELSTKPATIHNSVRFHLDLLASKAQVSMEDAIEIICFADLPPQIQPTTGTAELVGETGRLRIGAMITDDFGLAASRLLLRKSLPETESEPRRPDDSSYDAEFAAPTNETELTSWQNSSVSHPKALAVNELIEVAELDLASNEPFEIILQAVDTLGQQSEQTVSQFRLASTEEITGELSRERSKLLEEAERIVASQKAIASLAERISNSLEIDGNDNVAAVLADDLARDQSSLRDLLASPTTESSSPASAAGDLLSRLEMLQRRADDSGAPTGDLQNQLREALKQLDGLALPAMDGGIRSAEKLATELNSGARASDSLRDLMQSQQQASDAVESFRDTLAKGEMLALLRDEISATLMRQQAIAIATENLQIALLQQTQSESSLEQQQISGEQTALARQLTKTVDRMRKNSASQPKDPASDQNEQAAIAAALESLESGPAWTLMQRVALGLRDADFARAQSEQQRIIEQLSDALGALGGNFTQQPEQTSRLSDQTAILSQLAQRQRELVEEIRTAKAPSNAGIRNILVSGFQSRQSDLQDDTRGSLLDLQAGPSEIYESVQNGIEKQESAIRLASSADADDRALDATIESAQRAWELLEQASTALTELAEAEQAARRGGLSKIRDALAQIASELAPLVSSIAEQEAVQTRAESDPAESTAGQPRAGFEWETRWCTGIQDAAGQIGQLRNVTSGMPAFDWLLGDCEKLLERSVAMTKRNRLTEGLAASSRAEERLQSAIRAIDSAGILAGDSTKLGNDREQTEATDDSTNGVTLSDLLLIRQLQQSLTEQTSELETSNKPLTDREMRQMKRQLADEQRELSELVATILSQQAANEANQ